MRWLAGLLLCSSLWAQTYDVIISNGRIVDGTGAAWFLGDVGITGDRITRIAPAGLLKGATARRRIDASGHVVSPGFIDIQSHVRADLLDKGDGRLISKITQGITTEIMGEGTTHAPANEKTGEQADARFSGPHGFDAWLRAMQDHGSSANFGSFVGAGTLRAFGRGMAMGKATAPELALMKEAARNAMKDGAFGVASALIYPPNSYQDTDELIEIVKETAPFGGVYISHIRSEGDRLLEAVDEAIEIGKQSNVPVEIYHLKAVGKVNWPKVPAVIEKINAARRRGLDVQANMYPYAASGTGLTACLPDWTAADGKLYANISDPDVRKRIAKEMLAPDDTWESRCLQASPEGVLLVGLRKPEHQKFVGKRLSEVAAAMGKPWNEAALDLLAAERQRIATVYFVINEENIALQLKQPWIKVSTDAGASDPAVNKAPVHPRAYGTYPRVLGRYVRDQRVMPLEEAVRKMTSAVANRLSIRDRGVLREGSFADVVIFDPATVADRATFDAPHQLALGIPYVLVNGTLVVEQGQHTGVKPGRALRGPGYTGK
ncbi:MAG: D-aminoacylase [Bryobacteraceae bacterium]|nr:D-aminoacylase [Bryobacteraceae bacterium]